MYVTESEFVKMKGVRTDNMDNEIKFDFAMSLDSDLCNSDTKRVRECV